MQDGESLVFLKLLCWYNWWDQLLMVSNQTPLMKAGPNILKYHPENQGTSLGSRRLDDYTDLVVRLLFSSLILIRYVFSLTFPY